MLIPMVSTFGAASTTGIKATSSTSMKFPCRRKWGWGIDFPVKRPLKWENYGTHDGKIMGNFFMDTPWENDGTMMEKMMGTWWENDDAPAGILG